MSCRDRRGFEFWIQDLGLSLVKLEDRVWTADGKGGVPSSLYTLRI